MLLESGLVLPDGVSYEWSSKDWRWHPIYGRWTLGRWGFPKIPVYMRLSTVLHKPGDQFDFWRHVACYDYGVARTARGQGFKAAGAALIGSDGSFFSARINEGIIGNRRASDHSRDGIDDIYIGEILQGVRLYAEGEARGQFGPGDLYVYDAMRDGAFEFSRMNINYIVLRRRMVTRYFGDVLPQSTELARRLARAPLAPFLLSQMRLLGSVMHSADPVTRAGLLQVTLSLAGMAICSVAGGADGEEPDEDRMRFLSAMKLIESNIGSPKLGADWLGHLLGCSRATLYRSFARQGFTLAGAIRDVRMERARRLIEEGGAGLTIARIGMECGFDDPSHFSRVFKNHFGMVPTDLRR